MSEPSQVSARPLLEGVKVVDMTQYLSGPTVTRLMAELGADIVKIEQAPYGDPSRTYAIMNDGRSGYFVQQNRGKKSVCIDFDDPAGREVLDRLIADADVLVENYGPGVLERRGLDWRTLTSKHPRLIMASISGFGRESALSHKTAFDLIAQAYSGILFLTGPTDGAPTPVGTSVADVTAGVHAATGIGFALYNRERTGLGTHIDISMVDALFHAHEVAVQGPSLTKGRWRPKRAGSKSLLNAPMGVYKGPEGWIVLHVMASQWPGFCRAMGRPDLEHDPRFADLNVRQKNRDELNALIEEWMATVESDQVLLDLLDAERIPCAPVFEPANAVGHPYFESRQAVRAVHDPFLGELHIPGNPLRFSIQPGHLELTAPTLGQHNDDVLRSLGYSEEAIQELSARGVLRKGER